MAARRVALAGVLSSVEAAILFNSQKAPRQYRWQALFELGQALAKNTTRLLSAWLRLASGLLTTRAPGCADLTL